MSFALDNTLPTTGLCGRDYRGRVRAADGVPPYSYTVTDGALPAGLTLGSATGIISGAIGAIDDPATPQDYSFTITATGVPDDPETPEDESITATPQTVSRAYAIHVACPLITLQGLPTGGIKGRGYAGSVSARGAGEPVTYTVTDGALPTGLALDADTGAVTGIPTLIESQTFTVTATDANGCAAARAYTIAIIADLKEMAETDCPGT